MLTGRVQASLRYIASGSSTLAPILKATVGEVGREDGVDRAEDLVELRP